MIFLPFVLLAEEPYRYELAIAAVFRNDAAYLKEWIEFHRLLGVDHFFLYNHFSEDEFEEVLAPYQREGIVDLVNWPYEFIPGCHRLWINVQTAVYNQVITKHKEDCKWIAFIDTDEFLFPTSGDNLVGFLKSYEEFGGVCVSWRLYGTSNVLYLESEKLMIEQLTLAGAFHYHCFHKSIVNPRRVLCFEHSHSALYIDPFFHVNGHKRRVAKSAMQSEDARDLIRINHYWTRDGEYFSKVKLPCRDRRGWSQEEDLKRASILNQYEDCSIFRFIPALRKRM